MFQRRWARAAVAALALLSAPAMVWAEIAVVGSIASAGLVVDGLRVPSGTPLFSRSEVSTRSNAGLLSLGGQLLLVSPDSTVVVASTGRNRIQVAVRSGAVAYQDPSGETEVLGPSDQVELTNWDGRIREGIPIDDGEAACDLGRYLVEEDLFARPEHQADFEDPELVDDNCRETDDGCRCRLCALREADIERVAWCHGLCELENPDPKWAPICAEVRDDDDDECRWPSIEVDAAELPFHVRRGAVWARDNYLDLACRRRGVPWPLFAALIPAFGVVLADDDAAPPAALSPLCPNPPCNPTPPPPPPPPPPPQPPNNGGGGEEVLVAALAAITLGSNQATREAEPPTLPVFALIDRTLRFFAEIAERMEAADLPRDRELDSDALVAIGVDADGYREDMRRQAGVEAEIRVAASGRAASRRLETDRPAAAPPMLLENKGIVVEVAFPTRILLNYRLPDPGGHEVPATGWRGASSLEYRVEPRGSWPDSGEVHHALCGEPSGGPRSAAEIEVKLAYADNDPLDTRRIRWQDCRQVTQWSSRVEPPSGVVVAAAYLVDEGGQPGPVQSVVLSVPRGTGGSTK